MNQITHEERNLVDNIMDAFEFAPVLLVLQLLDISQWRSNKKFESISEVKREARHRLIETIEAFNDCKITKQNFGGVGFATSYFKSIDSPVGVLGLSFTVGDCSASKQT